jgi:fructoselysine-6-P-deglycase FrlB-like protein
MAAAASFVEEEIATQPACWSEAAALATRVTGALPERGARVAIVGCGTSRFIAQAMAALREAAGQGETDAFAASEAPAGRRYDAVLALSRSGTTTEVLDALDALGRAAATTLAITADGASPVAGRADRALVLDFADERSVVQTRFATTALALVRASMGEAIDAAAADAQRALEAPLPAAGAARSVAFLGTAWRAGLACEAALKVREAAGLASEAHPALEYRHGPISAAGRGTLVWALGPIPDDLADDVRRTGATVERSALDPMAELVRVQRFAVQAARAAGRDPDRPPHLARSVVRP